MDVTLQDILAARESRAQKQRELLARFGRPLICFTMNIPGPVKNDGLIQRGFFLGLHRLEAQLRGSGIPVLYRSHTCADTGCEGYWVADADAALLKRLCVQIEEADTLGRLFDLDVLTAQGQKLDRPLPRSCLLCGSPAQVCGRSRAHSVPQLQMRVQEILRETLNREDRQHLAHLAVKSLLYEVCVTPKPGLVDRASSGSHRDMDIFTFLGSASVLHPYFETCAAIGQDTHLSPQEVFSRLRCPGKQAEAAMYRETGGVNTHKGAIFSLGILCAAAGRLSPQARTPEGILDLCAQMTRGITAAELGRGADTAGQRLYRASGVTGVRGQAEAGFPAVKNTGLPVLRQGLSQGLSLEMAAAAALLHMLPEAQDTSLQSRSDPQTHREALARVTSLLARSPFPTREALEDLGRFFVEKNLSPGGSADLLSLTLFLFFLEESTP